MSEDYDTVILRDTEDDKQQLLIFICSKFHIKNVCSVVKLYDVSYIPDITTRWLMTSIGNQ